MQALEGRVPDTEVLRTRQGVSHIAYRVDDGRIEVALAVGRHQYPNV